MKIHCKCKQGSAGLLPRKGYLERFFQVAEVRSGVPGQTPKSVLEGATVGHVKPLSTPAPQT